MYSTTLNVNSSIIFLIKDYCDKYNIPKSKFIKTALNLAINYNNANLKGLTKYQKKDFNESWILFRIDFFEYECYKYLNARFRLRVSLSKLLLIGVILFFENMNKKSDNSYTYISRIKVKILENDYIYFTKKSEKKEKLE